MLFIVAVQSPSRVWLFVAPWTTAQQTSLSITVSWSFLKFMSSALVMPFSHLILSCPGLLLASVFPSIRDISSESAVGTKWPKYWSFSFSISTTMEYSLIYWAWPHLSEQDPVSTTVSLSHQEDSISLLSLSLRKQTEWKPQSQKTNQTDHMDHSFV